MTKKHEKTKKDIKEICLIILFFIGIFLSVVWSFSNKITTIPIEYQFGLIQTLPLIFWIGIILAFISLILGLKSDSEKAFFIKIGLFAFIVWNLPQIYENNPNTWDSFLHFDNSLRVTGILHDNYWDQYFHEYPGFFVFGFLLYKISNLDPLLFLRYYPLFASVLTFIALWLFFKRFTSKEYFRYSLIFGIFLNVWLDFHYSPQSFGMIIALLLAVCLSIDKKEYKIIGLLLGVLLIVSHPTNFILVIGIFTTYEILKFFRNMLLSKKVRINKIVFVLLLLYLCWTLVWATHSVHYLFSKLSLSASIVESGNLFDALGAANKEILSKHIQTTTPIPDIIKPPTSTANLSESTNVPEETLLTSSVNYLTLVSKIRFAVLILLAAVCFTYFAILLLKKANWEQDALLFKISWVLFLGVTLVVLQIGGRLNFRDRIFLYFMLIAPVILIEALNMLPGKFRAGLIYRLLIFVLFSVAFVVFLSQHYLTSLYILSDMQYKTSVISLLNIEYSDLPTQYRTLRFIDKEIHSVARPLTKQVHNYVIFDTNQRNWYLKWRSARTFSLARNYANLNYDKIYSNDITEIYS